MRNKIVYPYWLRLSFLRKRVVALCQFACAPWFSAHNLLYMCNGLMTRSTIKFGFLTPHFVWGVRHNNVCVHTDIDVVLREIRICSACASSALSPPSSALSFLPLICCHYKRPGESRTYITSPIMSNCYDTSSSDRFCWKWHKKNRNPLPGFIYHESILIHMYIHTQ